MILCPKWCSKRSQNHEICLKKGAKKWPQGRDFIKICQKCYTCCAFWGAPGVFHGGFWVAFWCHFGSILVSFWCQNDSKMLPKWHQNGTKMEPKRRHPGCTLVTFSSTPGGRNHENVLYRWRKTMVRILGADFVLVFVQCFLNLTIVFYAF